MRLITRAAQQDESFDGAYLFRRPAQTLLHLGATKRRTLLLRIVACFGSIFHIVGAC